MRWCEVVLHPPMSWSNRSFVPPPAGLLGSLAAAAARSASLSTCLAHRAPYTCPAGRRAGTVLLSPLHRASRLPVPVRGSPLCPVAGWQAGTVPLTAPSSAARQVVEPVHGPPAHLSLSLGSPPGQAPVCVGREGYLFVKRMWVAWPVTCCPFYTSLPCPCLPIWAGIHSYFVRGLVKVG